jgi:hypothetical protein
MNPAGSLRFAHSPLMPAHRGIRDLSREQQQELARHIVRQRLFEQVVLEVFSALALLEEQ